MKRFVVVTISKLLGIEKKYFEFLKEARRFAEQEVRSANLFGTTKVVLMQIKNNK